MDLQHDLVETSKALEWWRNLDQNKKELHYLQWQKVSKLPFKDWTYVMASTSTRCIQDIYELTHDLKI